MGEESHDDLDDLLAAWHAAREPEELFVALRDPMRRATRRGIRRILGYAPDEADVDDVLLKAFKELLKTDLEEVNRSLVGFACMVAYRRGMDRARSIVRAREQIKLQAWQLYELQIEPNDEAAAAGRERLLLYLEDCKSVLTAEQRDVIEATVQRQESLSNWVAARGTSYEAGRRMLGRGIATLRRCIDAKPDAARREEL